MKLLTLFFFFFACVCAFDFDYETVVVKNEAVVGEKLESLLTPTTKATTTTTVTTTAAQEPLGREVPSSSKEETSGKNGTTTSTTTTTVTTTSKQPAQEPSGREVLTFDVVAEGVNTTSTTTSTTLTTPGPLEAVNLPKFEIVLKPSLYALINEGLKSNLKSFEARIANLLYKREQMKEEIHLFADESSTDFAEDFNPDHLG